MTSWLSIAIRLIVVFTFLFGLPVIAIWGPPTWGPIKKWSLTGESPASLGLGYGTSNTQNHDFTVQQTNSKNIMMLFGPFTIPLMLLANRKITKMNIEVKI